MSEATTKLDLRSANRYTPGGLYTYMPHTRRRVNRLLSFIPSRRPSGHLTGNPGQGHDVHTDVPTSLLNGSIGGPSERLVFKPFTIQRDLAVCLALATGDLFHVNRKINGAHDAVAGHFVGYLA